MKLKFDIAVAGSGFAGSLMAMVAKRLGLAVVLLEKGTHPRMAIGESSTPLSNLLLEQIAEQYHLPALKPFTKWGSWQKSYPRVTCGLKRGFTFFHHDLTGRVSAAPQRQFLVAASPNDTVADTHWFRADFDHFLVRQAAAMGVEFLDGCEVEGLTETGSGWALRCRRRGEPLTLEAGFIIDATGPRGLLHRLLALGELPLPGHADTSALFAHFTDVAPFAGQQGYAEGGPPYPPDDAALHHVFDGGWMWVLRFNNGWTSAGVAASSALAKEFGLAEKEAGWQRLLDRLPEVKQQFACAKPQTSFTFQSHLSFRSASVAGRSWALLPSAAGFVDPLLSTGFPLTLLGVLRLGAVLQQHWAGPDLPSALEIYAADTEAELLATADLIAALYANMGDFTVFRTLSLAYFAAASFAETARRLGKPHLAGSFLLHTDPLFGPELRRILARARQPLSAMEKQKLMADIYSLVETFDVAGLCQRPVDHCYPVRAGDLLAGAHKVQASAAEIEALLQRTGFYTALA